MKVAVPNFAWQAGYGAFSVGLSNIEAVESYILRQEEHYHHFSFAEEYCRFLDRHQIAYNDQYIWD